MFLSDWCNTIGETAGRATRLGKQQAQQQGWGNSRPSNKVGETAGPATRLEKQQAQQQGWGNSRPSNTIGETAGPATRLGKQQALQQGWGNSRPSNTIGETAGPATRLGKQQPLQQDHRIEGRILDRITDDHIRDVLKIQELGTRLRIQEFLEKMVLNHSPYHFRLEGSKVFNDPVHGHMEMHPLCVAIIDTPEFQRLRNLKQLGACYFVFPGACHNRFEHSLGVCFLAGLLVKALRRRQPDLGITGRDVLCVQVAGLCHDLGHGPFSHMFDGKFIPYTRPERHWEHEDASIQMFDHLVRENQLEGVFECYGISAAERIFIKEQITGKFLTPTDSEEMTQYHGPTSEKSFLYEIVANKRNGVDVDKWDYFKRDCLYLGISNSFDHMRFIQFSRVIRVGSELQICVRDKEAFNMYEMFHTRHALHHRAYQHKVVQAVELMVVEALKEADQYILTPGKKGPCTISQCIDDMDAYMLLTDSVLDRILLSEDPCLDKAKAILHDIQRRRLYRCVGETEPITTKDIIDKNGDVIKNEILEELSEKKEEVARLELNTSRFVVQIATLDFGKKHQNPVNDIRFFSKVDKTTAVAVRASEVSILLPQELFWEQLVRVFLRPIQDKDTNDKCLQLLLEGFERWCKKNHLLKPKKTSWIAMTPYKSENPANDECSTPDRPVRMTKPRSAMKARQSITF
ncbi:hypothetical protein ACOMHN_004443 [Nucella lapillus]